MYFEGHSQWILKLLESIDWKHLSDEKVESILKLVHSNHKRSMSCSHLMCSSSCKATIDTKDVFPLLDERMTHSSIREFAVNQLSSITDDDLILYIPQLVYFLRFETYNSKLKEFLFRRSRESKIIAHYDIRYPVNPLYRIKSIDKSRAKIKDSATKPVKLTFNCVNVETNEERQMDLIFKKDDVRKDRVILNIISIMTKILKENIDPFLQIKNRKVENDFEDFLEAVGYKDSKKLVTLVDSPELESVLKLMRPHSDLVQFLLVEKDHLSIENRIRLEQQKYIDENLLDTESNILASSKKKMLDHLHSIYANAYNEMVNMQKAEIHHILSSIITYTVLPYGSEFGFIEVVQDAETLYDIYGDPKITSLKINEYLKKHNPSHRLHEVNTTFRNSMAVQRDTYKQKFIDSVHKTKKTYAPYFTDATTQILWSSYGVISSYASICKQKLIQLIPQQSPAAMTIVEGQTGEKEEEEEAEAEVVDERDRDRETNEDQKEVEHEEFNYHYQNLSQSFSEYEANADNIELIPTVNPIPFTTTTTTTTSTTAATTFHNFNDYLNDQQDISLYPTLESSNISDCLDY
ncbi:hypothetical protein PPL_10341 [Heterostelium album PN500]|uniref:PIK helical domain-containing protein n=1 Tax=Heterostelium pallidum (strain ATCC 26659 / Pp 5 / PN500) TaxID=670386 RepID=D3BQ21_HETP5|nr:hypothetical protein PPL_10341 [Heterostelium album PN500]EFA76572.1 hypothetical protein PPL_10341 [Heterostelium album PN500]|eukprot:XP_020428704.1 hypothetical protein PPL_10341 [Heterostelium album PN500]